MSGQGLKRNDLTNYGIDADISARMAAKYSPELEAQMREWVADLTGHQLPAGPALQVALKDGVVLCELANKLQPGAVLNINRTKMAFKQMENINNYLEWNYKLGMNKIDTFQTIDLFENQNMPQVIQAIVALSRLAASKGLCKKHVGPKLADENPRNFSEDVLNASKGMASQQMGFTGGANASGMSFGRRRDIDEVNK